MLSTLRTLNLLPSRIILKQNITTIQMAYSAAENEKSQDTAFKKAFRYFKAKKNPPDLTKVLDFQQPSSSQLHVSERQPVKLNTLQDLRIQSEKLRLRPCEKWRAYEINNRPGLLVLPDIFTEEGQVFWADKCLKNYPKTPNFTNLDAFYDKNTVDSGILEDAEMTRKLRWTTLGYHYDWQKKIYTEHRRSPMPEQLVELTHLIASVLQFDGYHAEAAIVNYYHHDSTLSGHVDRSEWNQAPPLFSFSFGQTAIYLQGGITLDTDPLPLFLRSGDVLVMYGSERLVYHGVPKIIKEKSFSNVSGDSSVLEYLNQSRVNITVRQVN